MKLSKNELEKITRRYTASLIEIFGPEVDIPAPDMNTNEQTMAWIMDTYSMHVRHTETAVVTGKPVELGGSLGRREATGRGCMIITRETLNVLKRRMQDTTIAIQGFGNVGSISADLLYQQGAKIVAVSDIKGGIYNRKGLNIPEVMKYIKENKFLEGYKSAEPVSNEDLLKLDCDVLIPAALENQITKNNAHHIKAKIIIEAANGPVTVNAEDIMEDKGIFVVPDILANAGGVTVSYFEWVQDRHGYFWKESTINERLEEIMIDSFDKVYNISKEYKVNMRTAAYMLAIDRVAYAVKLRGVYA
jgi:glutamate dehydrogenase (NAD(P)+)